MRPASTTLLVLQGRHSPPHRRIGLARRRLRHPALTSTSYPACVYDSSNNLLFNLAIPGGSCGTSDCWRTNPRGFTYKNKDGSAGGLRAVSLYSGGNGKARIKRKGLGAKLTLPSLPLAAPLMAWVSNDSNSTCFSSTFTTPSGDPLSTKRWFATND